MPVALGKAAEKVQDKLRAVLQGIALESTGSDMALKKLEQVVSFTTDFGTEAAFADYAIGGSAFNLFPSWVSAAWGVHVDG